MWLARSIVAITSNPKLFRWTLFCYTCIAHIIFFGSYATKQRTLFFRGPYLYSDEYKFNIGFV